LKFQAVAEKTAKDARGLLYFAAPGIQTFGSIILSIFLIDLCLYIRPPRLKLYVHDLVKHEDYISTVYNSTMVSEIRVVFAGGSRGTSPSLDLTFPPAGLSENL